MTSKCLCNIGAAFDLHVRQVGFRIYLNPACAHCFAKLLLHGRPQAVREPCLTKRYANAGFTGETPEPKRKASGWAVNDVVNYIESLSLGHVKDKFIENAIDGRFLMELSEEDLTAELGLTKLQARKVKERLP